MKQIIVFLFFSFQVLPQQGVLKLENISYSNFIKDEKAFALSNSSSGDFALVFPDKNTVNAYLFNSDFNKINQVSAESLRIKFSEIIGFRVTEQHYTTLFSTENRQFFGIVDFDFKTGRTVTEELDVDLKGEAFLEAVSFNNRFFMLSIHQDFDGLIIRELKEDRTFEKRNIQFNAPVSLPHLLTFKNHPVNVGESQGFMHSHENKPRLVEIDNTNPNSLETTSELNKLYKKDNNFIFTFDNFVDFTLVYILDLNEFSLIEKRFKKEKINNNLFQQSNSFLFENTLFQIEIDSEKLVFNITDFSTGILNKSYKAGKNNQINFKNSPFLQKNGAFIGEDKIRVLDETEQFLRKISMGTPAVAVQKIEDKYQITLGGTQTTGSEGLMGIISGGNINTVMVPLPLYMSNINGITYNPTFLSYGSYTKTKSIFIHSLFNSHFEHVVGEASPTVFDKIKVFEDSLTKHEVSAEEVFYHNYKVYFGYYTKKTKTYSIVEFTN